MLSLKYKSFNSSTCLLLWGINFFVQLPDLNMDIFETIGVLNFLEKELDDLEFFQWIISLQNYIFDWYVLAPKFK